MSASLTPGTVFAGDYRIVRPLASGGMGAVYVAHQLSTARERALKIMLGELGGSVSGADLKRRFEQEARVGAQIESEHVVEVVSAGVDAATGAPWLAMELLQGEDLASYLAREGALAPAMVAEIFEQIAHAVGAAHAKQIVHRDLKPENLFLAQTRRAGSPFMVKVLDFGIAKIMNQARTSATGAMGTPLWMAPEQTKAGERVTPAADVWALGLIAFRALAGKSYWKSAGVEDGSAIMLLREMMMEPIVAASARAAELDCPALPAGFDEWFAKCVDREPASRFADADVMNRELQSILGANKERPQRLRSGTIAAAPIPPAVTDGAAWSQSAKTELGEPPVFPAELAAAPKTPDSSSRRSLFIGGGLAVGLVTVVAIAISGSSTTDTAATASETPSNAAPTVPTPPKTRPTAAEVTARTATTATSTIAAPTAAVRPGGCPEGMALIDGGRFTMGSTDLEDEKPAHPEDVRSFCFDITEVTAVAYADCVEKKGCAKPGTTAPCTFGVAGQESFPINCVDWKLATDYCAAIGKRLPTEVEWEYAARGGRDAGSDPRKYPWGNTEASNQVCWNGMGNELGPWNRRKPCPVGKYSAGDGIKGLKDLAGNVAEWTSSSYCPYDAHGITKCASDKHLARGGSWRSGFYNYYLTASRRGLTRYQSAEGTQAPFDDTGIRCAKSL